MTTLIPIIVLVIAVLLLLFVLLTDGRYFGKALIYQVYDRLGPAIFGARSEAERWRDLLRRIHLRGDEAILDVGTAVGDLPLTIAAMPGFQGQVWGVDWSPRMIATAQATARRRGLDERVQFRVADLREALPFDDDTFDLVFCLGLLETLPQPARRLRELRRVLKPEGTLVLSLYQGWATLSAALSLDWYREHLTALGLQEIEVAPFRRNHKVVVARKIDPLRFQAEEGQRYGETRAH